MNEKDFENFIVKKAKDSNYKHMDYLLKRDSNNNYLTSWVDSAYMGWCAALETHIKKGAGN